MIYTLTLNPSLDYIMNADKFNTGAVNRSFAQKYLAGGKGINVSIVLSNMSVVTRALGFVAGFTGDEICRRLEERGINTDFVHVDKGESRINVKIKADVETELNATGPEILPCHTDALYAKLDDICPGDTLVLAGSIPKGLPHSIYSDIMAHIGVRGVDVVVDAEGDLLMNTLKYSPFLIKPNHHELGDIFGKRLETAQDIAPCARELQLKGARNVFVSMGGKGGVLISEDGNGYYCPAPEGRLANSTGAGDSAVAGFLYGYHKYGDYITSFAYGMCAGSASAFSTDLATMDEIQSIFEKQHIMQKIQLI